MIGVLSGRDIEAVNQTVRGLTELLLPQIRSSFRSDTTGNSLVTQPKRTEFRFGELQIFCMHFACSNRRSIRFILFVRSKSQ